jgi:hypothetical protein
MSAIKLNQDFFGFDSLLVLYTSDDDLEGWQW